MCRWIAYAGSPVPLDTLLFKPEHSLIDQSRHSHRVSHAMSPGRSHPAFFMNGDGVGVGWYGDVLSPSVYRGILPAWNDRNLEELAQQARGRMMLAHVRAASCGAIQQTNCHPFRHDRWLFLHNGMVAEFPKLKRAMDLEIDPALYARMEGSTDSERLFFLALTFGLADRPERALAHMAEWIETIGKESRVPAPLTMTLAACDGERIFAVRYSSPGNASPTLYHSRNIHALREVDGQTEQLPDHATIILSEPVDDVSEHWEEVPEDSLLVIVDGEVRQQRFQPRR